MMSQKYYFDPHKTFDQKAGIFVHHHGASVFPTVNLENYKGYINNSLDLVEEMGYHHISSPFTHISNYDSEFVTVLQYLVDEAGKRGISVMVIAQGSQNKLSEVDANINAEKYLQVMTQFIISNAGKSLIYSGINEPNSGTWYGQNNMAGYRKAIQWDNRLKKIIKYYDPTATFVEAVLSPKFGIPLIKEGLIDGGAYAMHPYTTNIGNKGHNVPEDQFLEATYATGFAGKTFAMTEFGIASEYDGTDPEDDWQGVVSPEEAGALTVRQMIIHDALGSPMQYNFILGYLYVFKKYQFFDLNRNITPTGQAVKNALQELKGFYFDYWLWADVGEHRTYIAKYVRDNDTKFVFWNADGVSSDIKVGSNTLTATSAPQYTTTNLAASVNTLIVQTPPGLKTIDIKLLPVNKSVPLQLPNVDGYQHNEVNATLDGTGKLTLEGDIIYRKADEQGLKVQAKKLQGSFSQLRLKSPDGSIWQAAVTDGKIFWLKNQGIVL